MFTMILISSVALLVAIVGSGLIWGLDVLRADEIEHPSVPTGAAAPSVVLPAAQGRTSLPSANRASGA